MFSLFEKFLELNWDHKKVDRFFVILLLFALVIAKTGCKPF